MSSAFTHLVWTRSKAKGARKLILLALADHADRKGEVQMSLRDIVQLSGLSKTSVEEHIQKLIETAELRKVSGATGRGKPCTYWITLRSQPATRTPDKSQELAPDQSVETQLDSAETRKKIEVYMRHAEKAAAPPEVTAPTKLPVAVEPVQPTSRTLVAPDPVEDLVLAPAPKLEITQHEVNRVLDEAGIMPPENQPFYWCRREHRYDLHVLLDRRSMDVVHLCAAIHAGKAEGRKLDRPARQIADIEALLPRRMMV